MTDSPKAVNMLTSSKASTMFPVATLETTEQRDERDDDDPDPDGFNN